MYFLISSFLLNFELLSGLRKETNATPASAWVSVPCSPRAYESTQKTGSVFGSQSAYGHQQKEARSGSGIVTETGVRSKPPPRGGGFTAKIHPHVRTLTIKAPFLPPPKKKASGGIYPKIFSPPAVYGVRWCPIFFCLRRYNGIKTYSFQFCRDL